MESNTFSTSAFIAVQPEEAYQYLCRLKNLDEWTLGSRMKEQVDADTWIGTASGYQRTLYYHVRRLENPRFRGIEWQCGYEYRKYFKSYPVLLFPPDYVEPGSTETGVYFHWVSVIDPVQRTPMIMQGIQTVHNSEARSLKAALEREAGLTEAAVGRHRIEADTIYVNAPIEMAAEFLGDLRTMEHWSHLLKPAGTIQPEHGTYLDEYRQTVDVSLRTTRFLGVLSGRAGLFPYSAQDDAAIPHFPDSAVPRLRRPQSAGLPVASDHVLEEWHGASSRQARHRRLRC